MGKPKIIAHRGASGYAPENTMAAFELALEMGADGIETDVHLTRDGELVLTHDPILGRTSPGRGELKNHTYKELSRLDWGSWFSERFKGESLPRLEDLLRLTKGKDTVLNIEIKFGSPYYPGLEEKLIGVLRESDRLEKLIISSFNHYSLLRIKELEPAVPIGFLTSALLIDGAAYVKRHDGAALHPDQHALTEKLVEDCHRHGVAVNTYTVNGAERSRQLAEAGVDGVITNYPDVIMNTINGKLT